MQTVSLERCEASESGSVDRRSGFHVQLDGIAGAYRGTSSGRIAGHGRRTDEADQGDVGSQPALPADGNGAAPPLGGRRVCNSREFEAVAKAVRWSGPVSG